MKFVRDANEKGTTVILDEHSFVNCRFVDCKVIYAGGDYAWENTTFVNCQLAFQGAAGRTAALLQNFGLYKPQDKPIQPPSGTTVH
jgi:hypothetical protein